MAIEDCLKYLEGIPDKSAFLKQIKLFFAKMDSDLLKDIYRVLSLTPECDMKDRMFQSEKLVQDSHHENALLQQALKESKKQCKTNEMIIRELLNQMKSSKNADELINKAFDQEFQIDENELKVDDDSAVKMDELKIQSKSKKNKSKN
jgi:hypothetical protein